MPLIKPPPLLPAPSGTHDCYFECLDANTCRLTRFGGNQIMIAGKRETIPAGLTLAPFGTAAWPYWYIYVYMSAGVMQFAAAGSNEAAPVIDAYGMPVHPTNAALTLVGMVMGGAATFRTAGNTVGAISQWNRKQRRAEAGYQGQSSASTTIINLSTHNINFLAFNGDFVRFGLSGHTLNNVAGYSTNLFLGISPSGAQVSQGHNNYSGGTAYANSLDIFGDAQVGAGVWTMMPMGSVNGNTGTWNAYPTVLFEG
jgi:hypothetical protein